MSSEATTKVAAPAAYGPPSAEPPPFTGPPDPLHVNKWLNDWDAYFEDYPSADEGRGERGQILVAARGTNALNGNDQWLRRFKTWYSYARKQLSSWEEFKRLFAEKVIGKDHWYIDVLQDFATYTQGEDSIDDYIDRMTSLGRILMDRNMETDANKWMRNAFKQYLVFRASPEIWKNLVQDEDFCNLLDSEKDNRGQIENALRRAAGGSSGGSRPALKYSVSETLGSRGGSSYTHQNMLPSDPQSLGNLKRVDVNYSTGNRRLWIQQLAAHFDKYPQPLVLKGSSSGAQASGETKSVPLTHAYLESLTVYLDGGDIVGLTFSDSNASHSTIGSQAPQVRRLAKDKHRIVGFEITEQNVPDHSSGPWGTSYQTTGIAVIFAPAVNAALG